MSETLQKINELQKAFVKDSRSNQGYIHITFCNGVHKNSHGDIVFRHEMSGAPMGEKYFTSLNECLNKVQELKTMQNNGELL